MYTEEEYKNCIGWGHSTWEAGADLCDAAGVPQLVIFHHDPDHDDDFMDKIAEAAENRRPEGLKMHASKLLWGDTEEPPLRAQPK